MLPATFIDCPTFLIQCASENSVLKVQMSYVLHLDVYLHVNGNEVYFVLL